MRKIKCELTIDLDSQEYECRFINVSKPGEDIEYDTVLLMVRNIFEELMEKSQDDDDPQITKIVH